MPYINMPISPADSPPYMAKLYCVHMNYAGVCFNMITDIQSDFKYPLNRKNIKHLIYRLYRILA